MDHYARKLNNYMEDRRIDGELLCFDASCHSVSEAAAAAGVSEDLFAKNICMVDSQKRMIVAIVKGRDRASASRAAAILKSEKPRLATEEEIMEGTGYPCGGTPSFGFDALFLVDSRIMEMDEVYTGGGSSQSLVRIKPSELLRANGGHVARVRR